MKRKIDARRRMVLNIYHLLKNRNSSVVAARIPEPDKVCLSCGRELKAGEVRFCHRCDLDIMVEAQEDYLKSLELDPEYRDNISEASQEFRARYEAAKDSLEDLKFQRDNI